MTFEVGSSSMAALRSSSFNSLFRRTTPKKAPSFATAQTNRFDIAAAKPHAAAERRGGFAGVVEKYPADRRIEKIPAVDLHDQLRIFGKHVGNVGSDHIDWLFDDDRRFLVFLVGFGIVFRRIGLFRDLRSFGHRGGLRRMGRRFGVAIITKEGKVNDEHGNGEHADAAANV